MLIQIGIFLETNTEMETLSPEFSWSQFQTQGISKNCWGVYCFRILDHTFTVTLGMLVLYFSSDGKSLL